MQMTTLHLAIYFFLFDGLVCIILHLLWCIFNVNTFDHFKYIQNIYIYIYNIVYTFTQNLAFDILHMFP